MEKIKLAVQSREQKAPNQLRREGKIPATLYGPGQPSENVQVDAKEFSRLPGAAYSHMIELEVAGKSTNAIIRDVQRVSTNHNVLNIEFYRVRLDRKLTVTVPLKFIGTSPAVVGGGQLIEIFQEVEIECLPNDIPDFVEVDLSFIQEIDSALHFSDLKISDKVEILNPLDEVVAKVITPREIIEEEPVKPATEGEAAAGEAAAAAGAEAPGEGATQAESAGKK
jgi:large subunit ribosomal protein L25